MDRLTATLKTVTPMFLGGAEPDKIAELRAPSIKGALRFWYRAIDPLYNQPFDGKKNSPTWEEKIFGSTEHGQGSFHIRVTHFEKSDKWDDNRYNLLDDLKMHPNCPSGLSNRDKKKLSLNGVPYLAFSFNFGDNKRKCIPVNADIRISFLFHRRLEDKLKDRAKKAILSSVWLLGHIGGLGARSRCGFGLIALHDWNINGVQISDLPIAHKEVSYDMWKAKLTEGLGIILESWFAGARKSDHLVLNKNTRFIVISEGQTSRNEKRTQFEPWEMALFEAGSIMKKFRMRREPDYSSIKGGIIFSFHVSTPRLG